VDDCSPRRLPAAAVEQAKDSIGAATQAAATLGGAAGARLVAAANSAFMDGFHAALRVGALVTLIGLVVTLLWLPARARARDVRGQADEFSAEHPVLETDGVVPSTGTSAPAPNPDTFQPDTITQ
jgi:hypothetical protein